MNRLAQTILNVGFFPAGILTTLLGPILPALEARWHLDHAQAGALFTAQFLGSLIGALLAGPAAVRWSLGAVIRAGFAISACGLALVPAGSWAAGLAGVAIYGFGLGLIIPSTNLLVAELNPGRRAAALNVLNFAWGAGAVAAAPMAALVLRFGGFERFLLGLAVLLASQAWAAGWTRVPVSPPEAPPQAGNPWRSSWFWLAGAFLFLYVGVENGLAGWLPSYVLGVLRLPDRIMAAVQIGFWGALLAVRLAAPAFLRRIAPGWLILSGLGAAMAGMLWLLSAASGWTLAAAAMLAGAGLATLFPTAVALFTERASAQGEQLTGTVFAMSALGGATLPWTVGILSARLGSLRSAMLLPLFACLLMAMIQIGQMRAPGRA